MDQSEAIQWLTLGGGVLLVAAGALVWAIRLEGLVRANTERLDKGDARFAAHAERDDAILRAVNELRVSNARIEAKIDQRNGGG